MRLQVSFSWLHAFLETQAALEVRRTHLLQSWASRQAHCCGAVLWVLVCRI